MTVRFTVLGEPVSTNAMYAYGGRRPRLSGRARAWKHDVAWAARAAGAVLLLGDVQVWIAYYHVHEKLHLDVGNVEKVLVDALQGVVFTNDRQVRRLIVERRHDPSCARVEVCVTEWDGREMEEGRNG